MIWHIIPWDRKRKTYGKGTLCGRAADALYEQEDGSVGIYEAPTRKDFCPDCLAKFGPKGWRP